jgi:hypothetical protein
MRSAAFFVIAWLLLLAVPARADSVALLPLDGEKRLEIYGQPVAAELARSLKAAGVEVVVVGANMAVPAEAKLIVDGTIKAKKQTITLELRIRAAKDGATLETLPPSSGALTNIDKVAADVAAHVVPAVKTELEALAKKATPPDGVKPPEHTDTPPVVATTPVLPELVVATSSSGGPVNGLLQAALDKELVAFAAKHAHAIKTVAGAAFDKKKEAATAVEAAGGELGISLRVLGLLIVPGKVPMARARVELRVVDRLGVKFDRVIVTDTIVGDREISEDDFAARVAREVLMIAHPNIRRSVTSWK